ncbi:MAG: hypothetical protein CMH49_02855 [Myxococcales bacterium]|nr:hypothetical protein [Myxococcales bacterium]
MTFDHQLKPLSAKRSKLNWCKLGLYSLSATILSLACNLSPSTHSDVNSKVDASPVDDTPGQLVTKPNFNDGTQMIDEGQNDFISASGEQGEAAGDLERDAAPEAAAEDSNSGDERSVEEGDIYRVVSDGLMANLNHYRGLQLIDIQNPSEPHLLSRLPLSGSPVEMYFVDGYAVVLMNDWWGYWGSRNDIAAEQFNGGLVALIDIQDTSSPELVSLKTIPGHIQTSRLTRGMGGDALFVVANDWSQGETQTILRSFNVNTGSEVSLNLVSELDLGGYVSDIQATPSTLLIARQQGWWNGNDDWHGTYVTLVDISDPSGRVSEGASVPVEGYVRRKTDLHIKNGILRVVSDDWSQGSVLATWNIDDIQTPISIDRAVFGENENLFASLFMDDRAFFVTYRRVDPFHAFSIDSEGLIEERTEYIISGWNDFFRPTFNQSRLIGIGMDDQIPGQDGQSIAVSLYSTDLEESEPFIARAHGDLTGWSWSEARWDDRAFSVIEHAVSVEGPNGLTETGLVLLPFSGYDRNTEEGYGRWQSGVQIFTFSSESVTARGVMTHDSPVRRSFEPESGLVGNLSELSLSLYDRDNVDDPNLVGRLDLAPEISRVFFIGEGPARHPVRLKGSNDVFYGWYDRNSEMAPAHLEVLPVGADVDLAEPLVSLEVPAQAALVQEGDVFYAITDAYLYEDRNDWESHYRSVNLSIFDLSDPLAPQARGTLDISSVYDGYESYRDYRYNCWGCLDMGYYWWGRPQVELHKVDNGLAIKTLEARRESLGSFESCSIYRRDLTNHFDHLIDNSMPLCSEIRTPYDERPDQYSCQRFSGSIHCKRELGGTFSCSGQMRSCVHEFNEGVSERECEGVEIDRQDLITWAEQESRRGECSQYEEERRWGSLRLTMIDLQDLDQPRLADHAYAPAHEHFEGLIAQENQLFYSYSVPVEVEGDRISYVRHFTRSLHDQDLDQVRFNSAVNLPGKLLLKRESLLISKDLIWGAEGAVNAINLTRLNDEGTRAQFISRHLFEGRQLEKLVLNHSGSGEERLVIAHGIDHRQFGYDFDFGVDENTAPDDNPYLDRISIFRLNDLEELGSSVSDGWSQLLEVQADKAVFRISGGILLLDISEPTAIESQAYLPMRSWSPKLTVEGNQIYIAAGRYGVFNLELDQSNLLPPL